MVRYGMGCIGGGTEGNGGMGRYGWGCIGGGRGGAGNGGYRKTGYGGDVRKKEEGMGI